MTSPEEGSRKEDTPMCHAVKEDSNNFHGMDEGKQRSVAGGLEKVVLRVEAASRAEGESQKSKEQDGQQQHDQEQQKQEEEEEEGDKCINHEKQTSKGEDGNEGHTQKKQKKQKKKKKGEEAASDCDVGVMEHKGVVVIKKEGFGFVKSPTLESRVYFHSKDCDSECATGSTVTFVLGKDDKTGKTVGKMVTTVSQPEPKSKKTTEDTIPGLFTGIVVSLPRSNNSVHVDDGMISFVDLNGKQQQAMFGQWRLAAHQQRDTFTYGVTVQFKLAQNTRTKVYKAFEVEIDEDVLKAAAEAASSVHDAPEEVDEVQYGKVALMKKAFGFIKRVEHAGDLFFHFSEVVSAIEDIKVGDDLQFFVKRDESGKCYATNVSKAQPGTVQFEVVGNELYHGVVIEKPFISKSYEKSAGVIEFVDKPLADGRIGGMLRKKDTKKILFYASDSEGSQSLRQGDHVTFRMLTDLGALHRANLSGKAELADLIGRRAAQVSPIKSMGTIVDINKSKKFGFLTWDGNILPSENKQHDKQGNSASESSPKVADKGAPDLKKSRERLFFSTSGLSEVLNVGDIVYFLLHAGDREDHNMAAQIKLKSRSAKVSAPKDAAHSGEKEGESSTDFKESSKLGSRRRAPIVHRPAPIVPKGPDGTRGFGMGRGSFLDPPDDPAAPGSRITGMFTGLRLDGIFSPPPRSLSVEALPFLPSSSGATEV